jgi:hypothetical protein
MEVIKNEQIENIIFTTRGVQVMIDYHLAELYGVETKRLNEQVKRNMKRFPNTFMFQLSQSEWDSLQSQIATTKTSGNLQSQIATAKRRTLPYVFTEQGVAMLSSALNSDRAIEVSIQIMQAFVNMRKFLLHNASVFQRLDHLELKQLQTDEKLERVFKALEAKQPEPDKGIFFDGQVFDAYAFVAGLIKNAQKEIILIDNFIDESVLTLLSKRKKGVQVIIYTKNISKALQLDMEKHHAQYPEIQLKTFAQSHDRFLLIDQTDLYHLGASLKDLGKKWFAFSRMDSMVALLLNQLNEAT